jgi:hypothetical protein
MITAQDVLYVGEPEVDLGDLGFGVNNLGLWWSGVSVDFAVASPYGARKSVPAPDGSTPPIVRTLRLVWAGTLEARETALDALRRAFPLGIDVRVRVGDSDRYAMARRNSDLVDVLKEADWEIGDVVCSLPLTFYDAAKYSAEVETLISGVPTTVDVGTLPSDWDVEIEGPASDPEVVVADLDDNPLYSFPMEGDIADGDSWVIDFANHAITLVPAVGAPSNILSVFPIGAVDVNDNPAKFQGLGTGAQAQVRVHVTSGSGTMHHTPKWG